MSRASRSARQSVVDDALGPDDSASQVGHGSTTSHHSNSIIVRRLKLAAQRAALSEERQKLELEELLLRQRKVKLDQKAALEAEKRVLDE